MLRVQHPRCVRLSPGGAQFNVELLDWFNDIRWQSQPTCALYIRYSRPTMISQNSCSSALLSTGPTGHRRKFAQPNAVRSVSILGTFRPFRHCLKTPDNLMVAITPEDSRMKCIIATGIVLLSLSSVAEAHRLSGTVTYYGGSDRLCGRRTASGATFNCAGMTAAHRTLPFGTVLTVQSGGRSIQVTVTDRGPFTGAFLDLSPAAANALGCRCTHRGVTATVMQMGSGETVVASRGRQRPVAAAVMPLFVQPTNAFTDPSGTFGSSMAMAPAPRYRDRHGRRHY